MSAVPDPSSNRGMISRRGTLKLGLAAIGTLSAARLLSACGSSEGSAGGQAAAATPVTAADLKAYDASAAPGEAPKSLAKLFGFPGAFDDPQSLAFSDGIKRAVESRGLKYQIAVANGDLTKITDQTQQMLVQKICGMFQYPFEVPATQPLAQQALDAGTAVFGYSRAYTIMQFIEDQGADGKAIGDAAVSWIKANLGGSAKVCVFNDIKTDPTSIPRNDAVLAALKSGGPGIEIVAQLDETGGSEKSANAFATVLQQHPDINVVVGGGEFGGGAAYSVFDSKGKGNDPHIYISVNAASTGSLDKVASGSSSIKAGFIYPWPLFGYAVGQFSADWLAGKSIPRLAMPPGGGVIRVDSADAVTAYKNAVANIESTWNNPAERDKYLSFWGNINYAQRASFWREVATLPNAVKGA